MPGRHPRSHDQSGATLVEFAVVFPVLLVFVIAAFGLLWIGAVKLYAGQAAKEGARYASLSFTCQEGDTNTNCSPTTVGERRPPDLGQIVARINSHVPMQNDEIDDVHVVYEWNCAQRDVNGLCDSQQNPPPNAVVRVSIVKRMPAPFRVFAGVFSLGDTVTASADGKTRQE